MKGSFSWYSNPWLWLRWKWVQFTLRGPAKRMKAAQERIQRNLQERAL